MFPLSLVMAGIGGIGSIIHSFGANSRLSALQAADPTYKANPIAAQRLGMAQTLLNARMPGAQSMERNIYANQANQQANVGRNATDSSQALAMGAAAQGQSNQAFQNLGTQEQQDYYNRMQNLSGAQQGQIAEGDKVYQDQVRRFQDMSSITGAKLQNTQTGFNSLTNFGLGAASLATQMGGGGGGGSYVDPSASRNSFMGMQPMSMGQGMQPGNIMQGQIDPNSYYRS